MTFQSFDLRLTDQDILLYRRLWQWSKDTRSPTFTSDTVRQIGLAEDYRDTYTYRRRNGKRRRGRINVGTPLARMVHAGLIQKVAQESSCVEANHCRKVYRFRFKGVQPC